MALTAVDKSLLLAAYFRGGSHDDDVWTSNSDQIVTLSLFYTGDISTVDCRGRFARRSYIDCLYDNYGRLSDDIQGRYSLLINLVKQQPLLIQGTGDFTTPADPTYTACWLTDTGLRLCSTFVDLFPLKPDFSTWPDRRTMLPDA